MVSLKSASVFISFKNSFESIKILNFIVKNLLLWFYLLWKSSQFSGALTTHNSKLLFVSLHQIKFRFNDQCYCSLNHIFLFVIKPIYLILIFQFLYFEILNFIFAIEAIATKNSPYNTIFRLFLCSTNVILSYYIIELLFLLSKS